MKRRGCFSLQEFIIILLSPELQVYSSKYMCKTYFGYALKKRYLSNLTIQMLPAFKACHAFSQGHKFSAFFFPVICGAFLTVDREERLEQWCWEHFQTFRRSLLTSGMTNINVCRCFPMVNVGAALTVFRFIKTVCFKVISCRHSLTSIIEEAGICPELTAVAMSS